MLSRTGTIKTNVDTARDTERRHVFVHRRRANAGGAAGRAGVDAAAGAAAEPPLGQLYGTLFYLY